MSDDGGSATDIDRSFVSSGLLSTPNFTLVGSDDFLGCHTDFMPTCRQKMVLLSLPGYRGEIESDSQNAWTCMHTIVPGSVLLL